MIVVSNRIDYFNSNNRYKWRDSLTCSNRLIHMFLFVSLIVEPSHHYQQKIFPLRTQLAKGKIQDILAHTHQYSETQSILLSLDCVASTGRQSTALHAWYSCISSLVKQCQDIWRKHRNRPVIPHCSTPHNISLEICLCFDLCVLF